MHFLDPCRYEAGGNSSNGYATDEDGIFFFFFFYGVEAIDNIMKLGMAHPMGPLQLADFIGLDVCLSILKVMQDGWAINTRPARYS